MKIRWQQIMTNKRVVEMAAEISCEVRRRWYWLGHVLRREAENDCIGLDTRRTKGERETDDHLEKDYGEGEKQGRVSGRVGM